VQRAAWDSDDIDIVPLHIMLTIARNGGVVLGAFAQDRLVGFVLGFLGTSNRYGAEAPATVKLKHCSHQLGVLPEWQSRGVGYALKVAQREAVLNQGVRLITWTYDPLESKNARLNIAKLGAVCNTYIRDYGGCATILIGASRPIDFRWIGGSRRAGSRHASPASARRCNCITIWKWARRLSIPPCGMITICRCVTTRSKRHPLIGFWWSSRQTFKQSGAPITRSP
jgi:GNAT superfamily N-acetyltransferase